MGAVSVSAFMPRTCIVNVHIVGDLQSGAQDVFFLDMKTLFAFNENLVYLPRGDINAHFLEPFQKKRLGDHAVVVLVKDISDEDIAEVTLADSLRDMARDKF